jgi:predicted ATPase
LVLTGCASEAVENLTSALAAYQSTGATIYTPFVSSHLARAYAQLGQFAEARRLIDEATTAAAKTNEKWSEAEIQRTSGEIALLSPEADRARAEVCFVHALAGGSRPGSKILGVARGNELGQPVA